MASIEDRGEGRFRVRYRGPDGRQRSRTFRRKTDARAFANTIEADKVRGQWIDGQLSRTTFSAWSSEWMKSKIHLRASTTFGYESILRIHLAPEFGPIGLAQIEPIDVQRWVARLSARGLSSSRIRQCYRLLSMILKAAVESRYLARSPCVGVKLPPPASREMRPLSPSDVARVASATPSPADGLLITFLAYTGLRFGEAAALQRSRCELVRSRIRVDQSVSEVAGKMHVGPPKGGRSRSVALPGFLRDALADHLGSLLSLEDDALVFPSPEDTPLRNSNFFHRVWTPACEEMGWGERVIDRRGRRVFRPNVRIHDLRHTCASLLIAQGAHPKAVQMQLGHASAAFTLDVYGHLFPDQLDSLAAGLDAAFRGVSQMWPEPLDGGDAVDTNHPSDQRWGGQDSNLRPRDYESPALTN